MTTTNIYVIKALDSYPYDLEGTFESLTYALSYDNQDVNALCLMARFYAEQLKDFEMAKSYFEDALSVDVNAHFVYPYYIDVLIRNEDYDAAEKLIAFGLKIKGSDKAMFWLKRAIVLEYKMEYKAALKALKEAKKFSFNDHFTNYIKATKTRIKGKMPKKRKKGE